MASDRNVEDTKRLLKDAGGQGEPVRDAELEMPTSAKEHALSGIGDAEPVPVKVVEIVDSEKGIPGFLREGEKGTSTTDTALVKPDRKVDVDADVDDDVELSDIIDDILDEEDLSPKKRVHLRAKRKRWMRLRRMGRFPGHWPMPGDFLMPGEDPVDEAPDEAPGEDPDDEAPEDIPDEEPDETEMSTRDRIWLRGARRRWRRLKRMGRDPGPYPTPSSIRKLAAAEDGEDGEPDSELPPVAADDREAAWSPLEMDAALGLGSESPPSYRDFTMDDPLGMGQHAKERSDENLAGRQVVEEMMQMQDDINRNANSVNQRIFDAIERLGFDNSNDERRINDLTAALERSRTTLTDVNI